MAAHTTRHISASNLRENLTRLGAGVRMQQIRTQIDDLNTFLTNTRIAAGETVHWTQRPENAVKLANARLRSVITRQKNRKER